MSNLVSDTNSYIYWKDNYTFEIDITLPLRKAGIDSITGNEDEFIFYFMNETRLTIDIPHNLDNMLKVIESDLLRWDGYYEGYGLPAYIIKRIVDHIKDHIKQIKYAIRKLR